MDKYQYYIISRLGTRQVYPLGKLSYSYDHSAQDNRVGYIKSFNGNLTFTGEDFHHLYKLESSTYRCEDVTLSIWKLCGGEYVQDWQVAQIYFNTCDWDLDKCAVSAKLNVTDKYSCYEEHKDETINLLTAVTHSQTITLATGTIDYLHFVVTNGVPDNTPFPPDPDIWGLYHDKIEYSGSGRVEHADYARYDLGGGNYQPVLVHSPVSVSTDDGAGNTSFETTWQIYTDDYGIDNGMKLQDVFETFLSEFCDNPTLVSNFFQWNPDTVTDTNYVTGENTKVKNLILFQKSDVKRPADSANATIAEMTFEELLKNICVIFNCLWDIEDDGATFRIEHYSYWQSVDGLDLTGEAYKKFIAFKRKYSYNVDSMPKFEQFKFMESRGHDFTGTDIWYDSKCVSQDAQSKNKLYAADKITTDLALVTSNPSSDSKVVSDDGFVLVACYDDNMVITEAPVLNAGEYLPNNSLGWAHLHRDYYRHGRVLLQGYMNRELTDFESSIKTKLQEKLSIPLCCDSFNPEDLVTTNLTDEGEVSKATYNFETEMLELEVLFDANRGLYENHAPVALGTSVVCSEDSYVDIDVTGLVSDADGDLDLSSIGFVTNGSLHGTVVLQAPGIIRYTPTTGYSGSDAYFYYYIKDSYSEKSLPALVSIDVTAIASAVDDSYVAFKNETRNIAAPGVMSNDGGPAITVTGFDAVSAHGGTVSVNSDGSFSYTPALNYTGTDTFDYTITDSGSNTSTATVTLDVQVRQMVYIRLTQTVVQTNPIIIGTCGTADPDSKQVLSNIVAHYYSDAGGTVPFDITNYDLTVNYRRATVNNYPSPGAPTNNDSNYLSTTGTSYNLFGGPHETHRALYNCSTGAYAGTDFTDTYSLLSGTHYAVI